MPEPSRKKRLSYTVRITGTIGMIVPGHTILYRRLCCKFCKKLREIYKENGWCLEERVINGEMDQPEVLHQAEETLPCVTINGNRIGDCVQTLLYLQKM